MTAFGQGGGGTLTGTVEDVSRALIPGVSITATNTNTGVVSSTVSNEAGAYNIPALLPGIYRLTASLPGFQGQSINTIELGNETRRFNFTLQLAGVTTNIDVSIDATALLTTSGATVGEVLSSQRALDLPMVSGDVLDLVRIMPGVRIHPAGAGFDTFAGMSANTVNTVRDGLSVTDGRYLNGIFASSTINPDLVGEIRMVLTPVDAEMGRGNGQVQITTRSGTNRYSGSAVWSNRNTALNANTWDNNNDLVTENGVTRWQPTPPNWSNENQVTVSFGGPIVRNKTFFFGLYDRNKHNQRSIVTGTVLTDLARQGIFRYWEGWNNGNALAATPAMTANANVIASVGLDGLPLMPFRAQGAAGGPYTGNLRCMSVFGTKKVDGSNFVAADCPGGIPVYPTGGIQSWDSRRPVVDPTGFIAKYLEAMPRANYFGAGDGLNTAGVRWLRGNNANNTGPGGNVFLQTGTNIGADRTQYNIKVDHNFNTNHKANAGLTFEKSGGADFLTNWPNSFPGETQRRSRILTSNLTSTLSPALLNEARFGIRITKTETNAPWDNPNVSDQVREYFLTGGPSAFADAGSPPMPAVFNPGDGIFEFSGANSLFNTNPNYLGNNNPLYSLADTVRWTKGAHAFRMGGELRITRSNGYNFLPRNVPLLEGGSGNYPATGIALQSTANPTGVPGMLTTTQTNVRNMLYLMSASIGGGSVGYWIDSPDDVDLGRWEDYITRERKFRDQRSNEWSAFFQDDWKVSRNLTLNLGLRYEYYGVPYLKGGFTSTAVDYGAGLFGVGRDSVNEFNNWLYPGNIYLSGYGGTGAGQTASTLLRCTSGVQQSALLPASNCDSSKLTSLLFVGPDSPNPDLTVAPDDKNNFGPVVGFAWQVPWFGEGKTTIRGGYSITYGGSGRDGIALDAILGGAPGATNTAALAPGSFTTGGVLDYLDLTKVPMLVPITPTLAPGGTFPIYQQAGAFEAYAPDWVTPYTQNFNLSLTRSLSRNFTLDMRYVGTRGMKLSGSQVINEVNVFNNPVLFDAFERVRRGEDVPLFDQIFAGLNLNSNTTGTDVNGVTRTYGPVGTVVNGVLQTGTMHLRRAQGASIANGNYEALAAFINGNGANLGNTPVLYPTGVTVGGRVRRNGCDRIALGTSIGGAPAGQVQTLSGLMPILCLPENFITMNPQMGGGAEYVNNTGSSNYHSLQTQLIMRPIHGISLTGTYTWSKTLFVPNSGYTDFRDRRADYTLHGNHLSHDFRTNGTFELPIGPNKLLMGNSTGWLARLVERWQTSFIFNVYSGRPVSVTGQQTMWAGSDVDIVGPFDVHSGNVEWGTITTNAQGNVGGTYFGFPSPYMKVQDPVCVPGGLLDHTDAMGWNLRGNVGNTGNFNEVCTLDALADSSTGQILLQNAQPGKRGTLGRNTIATRGVWSMDGSVSKTFRITESKSAQIRVDATNMLNHPTPADPTLGINSGTEFGYITGDKTGSRSFRGSLRITF